eukprot:g5345.t1
MRIGLCQSVLYRVGALSRQLFGRKRTESDVPEMSSLRCSPVVSKIKTESERIPETNKKGKNTIHISIRRQPASRFVKPRVASNEEEKRSQKLITELKTLPGVGPRNAELLSKKGLSVESLKNIFMENFEKEQSPFIDYLREEVGIRHKCHCQSIAGFLADKLKDNTIDKDENKRLTFSIEGNISAGKTSFLGYLSEHRCEIHDLCEFVREPVDMWQKVGGHEENNLLQRFYDDPGRHAYEFQNYVFLTRLKQNRSTFDGEKPLRIMERSVFSDRLVFVRAVHEAQWMDDMQLQLYDSWFNPLIKEVPGLIPDGFIYLRANPETCLRRLKRRARNEELTVSAGYLEGLHNKHEDWFTQNQWTSKKSMLVPQSNTGIKQLSAQLNLSIPEAPVPPELEGSIVWLGTGGDGILSQNGSEFNHKKSSTSCLPDEVKAAMFNIPALVLDYDQDFDLERDEEAKKHYAKKVKAYFDYVKLYRRNRCRFYLTQDSENLRIKWDIVDSLPPEILHELRTKQFPGISETRNLHSSGSYTLV